MTKRQRGWNKHEAAILLEGLLEVLDNGASRKEVIKRVSCDLRKMACQQGEDIDEIFRNENGISFQIYSMESAVKGYTVHGISSPKVFEQLAEIYRTDRQEYEKLLREARAMINKKHSCEADFMSWLSTKVSPTQLSKLSWCYAEIGFACMEARILNRPLFETTDIKVIRSVHQYIEQDKIFRIRHRKQYSKLISASHYYLMYITKLTAQAAGHEGEKKAQTPASPQIAAAVPMTGAAAPATQSRDTAPQDEKLIAGEDEIRGDAEGKALPLTLPENDVEKGFPNIVSASEVAQETVPQIEEPTADDNTTPGEKGPEPEILSVDFESAGNFAYTKPCYFSYFEESKEPCSSWTELYVTFFATLEDDYPHIFKPGMSFSPNGGRSELATASETNEMFAPKPVPGTNYVLETNISESEIVRKMKYILDLCAVDYENVVIRYTKKHSGKENREMPIARPQNPNRTFSGINRFSFHQYLLDVQKLSPATSRSYSSAIGICENFAREHDYTSWRLYTSNLSEAQATAAALFNDSKFIGYNDRWHLYEAAITKLLAFIRDNGSAQISATAPNEPILPNSGTEPTVEVIESAAPEINSGNAQKTSQAERSAARPVSMQRHEAANPKQIAMAEKIVRDADMGGITYDSLRNTVRLTMVATKDIVRQCNHIVEIKDRLYHEDAFIDWNDGAKHMCLIMEKLMQKNNGYISAAQLYDYARVEMHLFLNDNGVNDERAVYEIAQHLFEKNCFEGHYYTFTSKTHISMSEVVISSNFDIICKFAADQGGIFREDDLADYLAGLGIHTGNLRNQMRLNKEPVFFLYEPGTIISAKSMRIDDSWKESVMRALNNLLNDADDHIILRQIQPVWYDSLPALLGHRRWTPLLLQFVLHFYGKEFGAKTIMAMKSQSMDTLHAMLVKADSPIQNFGDAVIAYLMESETEQRSFEAEELRHLLVKTGMIQGNELIWNMPKALAKDERFAWDAKGENVTVRV